MTYPAAVRIREVGPRDGIQSEKADVPTSKKVALINALSQTGLRYIEAVSFVSPKAIPQMADAAEVLQKIDRRQGVFFSALVPNRKGAELAADAGADGMQVFIAASESYNLSNVRKHVQESIGDVAEVVAVADRARVPVEGTISTAFGCPYEGDVPSERVVQVARWMMETGIDTISFGDTTGMGTPRRVRAVIESLRSELPSLGLNMHFHDTRGTGLANVVTALEHGVDYFDASIGGMGGSPFAAGATGNIATEDLVHMLSDMEVETGVELERLIAAARLAQGLVAGELPSKMLRAGPRDHVAGPITSPGGSPQPVSKV